MDASVNGVSILASVSSKPEKENNWLAVVACISTFVFLYTVDVTCIIIPWLSYSVPGITNLFLLTFTSASGLYCYLVCTFRDPGRVPVGWSPDAENGSLSVLEVKKKGGAMRYCQKCQQYKPPRSHHCRKCQRCVLRMDHHCPAVNNCIGHANYKSFLLMLTYANVALAHTLGLIATHTMHMMQLNQQQHTIRAGPHGKPVNLAEEEALEHIWIWAILQCIAFMVSLPVLVGLMMLLGWHVHLMLTNKTTIEYQEGVRAEIKAEARSHPSDEQQHPYDLGPYHNLHEILGDSAASWLTPPCAPTPGGTVYATTWDFPNRADSADFGM